ncbi:RHS repeat domain-containing protein [Pseudomonas sp. NFACC45]|uniref:RHS repeat domain-containing protein n=1 Tax=Pseudomonas sp. NFACC45 TaxID=1566201 RepID=UPI0008E2EC00|nr:RHS repeat-associated core domain-containing protein [Pseudomonas sp. NFACC45]SFH10497.1 insecticidal toxin complex protein TccC [Pseudomonas sp. NFACC45]
MTTLHSRTPDLVVFDSRGLPARHVGYLRSRATSSSVALVSRQRHNAAGHLVEQWDPRLFGHAPKPNQNTLYNLAGHPLRTDSVDAGWRLELPGLADESLHRWDQRASHWRIAYDQRLRPIVLEEHSQAAAEVDTFTYADATADAGHNLRGQLLEQSDPSGTLRLDNYSLLGRLLRETRAFEDGMTSVSQYRYGPLDNLLEQTDAGEHRQQADYDLAGQLKQARLQLNEQAPWLPVLQNARYDAAGQIIEQQLSNGIVNHWTYDPADGRLQRQQALNNQTVLQDFEYAYDPVGNITLILDHAFTPSHFANQRVDGHRRFSYDSLYRLLSASGYDDGPPPDMPGLPQPTDPNDRRNYLQTYEYDHGGNLIKLTHVREGASHTRQMFVDPHSNRSIRWEPGDPDPSFNELYDRHGNLLLPQPGRELKWNARDQLSSVTLVKRDASADDQEHYRYSQGQRVYKRHDTYTATTHHFHAVHYLPGLEIRTRDTGEQLHVITVDAGLGSVRCLHWVAGKPAPMPADQLRYSLLDHLSSSLMEFDQQARLISHEGYYPFGATAWMSTRSEVEVSYKTLRYGAKEMDVSGLYAYGARYYAPWLQRWISADPAGDVDGLNLYGFVGNNPLRYVDDRGTTKAEWQIMNYSDFIAELGTESATALAQIDNVIHKTNIGKEMLKNLAGESVSAVVGFLGGYAGAEVFGAVSPQLNEVPYLGGLVGGNIGADVGAALADASLPTARVLRPLIPQTSAMSVEAIDRRIGLGQSEPLSFSVQDFSSFFLNRVTGSVIPAMNLLNLSSRAQEAEDIKMGLTPVKIKKIDTLLAEWKSAVESRWSATEAAFKSLGKSVVYPGDVLPNVNPLTTPETLAPIHHSVLQRKTLITLDYIARAQKGMAWYKEMSTTDNQFLLKQARGGTSKR